MVKGIMIFLVGFGVLYLIVGSFVERKKRINAEYIRERQEWEDVKDKLAITVKRIKVAENAIEEIRDETKKCSERSEEYRKVAEIANKAYGKILEYRLEFKEIDARRTIPGEDKESGSST